MGNGRLRLLGAFATLPFLGLGYSAVDMTDLSMKIELALSGASSEHGRQTASVSKRSEPSVLVPYEARRLFAAKGKGPRADLYLEVNRTSYIRQGPRRVVAALTPVDIEVTTQASAKGKKDHVVNRSKKGSRLKAPVTTIMRVAPKTVQLEPPPPPTNATAALLLASIKDSFDHRFVGKTTRDPRDRVGQAMPGLISRGLVFKGESEADYQTRQRRCLASAIYFEARGEPGDGRLAVAQVVMNRVRSPAYPDTICGVVFQGQWQRKGCQFSFACDGQSDVARDQTQWAVANKLAKQVLKGEGWLEDIDNATHYHATYVAPPWRRHMKRIRTIGRHIFYRAPSVPIREENEIATVVIEDGNQAPGLKLAQNE